MKKIAGAYSVLMTPFVWDKPETAGFEKQISRLNGTGVSGYVVNGSTSEFIQLSLSEQKLLTECAASAKAPEKQLIVGAGTGNVADTLELCRHAYESGAEAVLVCPPYYFKYTEEEREKYFLRVADGSPLPVLLYNIPFFTQEIELSLVYRLLEHDNVIGIKDSSANMKRLQHMVGFADGKDVSVLTGTDDILFPALVGGCDGSMTAFATVFPEKITALYEAIARGRYATAKEIQLELLPLLRKADGETFPKGYKRLMEEVSGIAFKDKEARV